MAIKVTHSKHELLNYHSEMVSALSTRLKLSPEEINHIQTHPAPRIISTLPLIAGSRNPEKISIVHLISYCVGTYGGPVREFAEHTAYDDWDIENRIELIGFFPTGDRSAINHGMALLKLACLNDHFADKELDLTTGHHNPFNSGAWDYEEEIEKIDQIIRDNFSSDLDSLVPYKKGMTLNWA